MKWDETYNYTDQFGLVHTRREFGGNGLLYLSECIVLACLNKTINAGIVSQFNRALDFCTVEPGLYKRSKENYDNQGPDDFIGLLAASGFVNPKYAQDFIAYGKENAWNYNIPSPRVFSLKTWFGRFPALIAHAYHSIGADVPVLHSSAWIAGVIGQTLKSPVKDQSGWMLSWLMVQNYIHNGKSTYAKELAVWIYKQAVKAKGIQFNEIFKAYNGGEESEPLHPLRRYWFNNLGEKKT